MIGKSALVGPLRRQRGIALFGGNFILPYENQHHLSNSLSVKYLNICQKFNSQLASQPFPKHHVMHQSKSAENDMDATANFELPHRVLEYIVLAPRQVQTNCEKDSYYDIATIVQLEKCKETGAIKAISRGVDSLVRIINTSSYPIGNQESDAKERFSRCLNNSLREEEEYSKENRLIIRNDPRKAMQRSFVHVNEMPFLIQKHRKLFFCDYETLHAPEEVCEYSQVQKDSFVHYICYLARQSGLGELSDKEFVKSCAKDGNSLFPRVQLLKLLKHFDSKYYYTYRSSQWLQKKYEILSNRDDHAFLAVLLNIQDYFSSNKII